MNREEAHLVANLLKVEYTNARDSPCEPFAIVLFLAYGVADEGEEGEMLHLFQWLKVTQFGNLVVGED
jgi:hypothetical protein